MSIYGSRLFSYYFFYMSETSKTVISAKGRPMLFREGKTANINLQYYPAQETEIYGDMSSAEWNSIFRGDNYQVLSHLIKQYRGQIKLIYIDPPFDSKADYVKKIKFKWGDMGGREQNLFEEQQYSDIWGKDEYLQFMYERLLLLRELLADEGSIYLHCDWHKSHFLRCIMDEVFWDENFQNEIVRWYRTWWSSQWKRSQKHDTLLFYSRSNNMTFNTQKEKAYTKAKWRKAGIIDYGWWTAEFFEDDYGVYNWVIARDVRDVSYINSQSDERVDYPTQKPEALLERIIKASSNPGDIVLDCFMGSGTTCAVAQKLGRRWIGCDINTGAIQTTIKRITKILEEQKTTEKIEKSKNKTGGKTGNQEETKLDKTWPFGTTFKVYNVNEYNLFKNKEEGITAYKEILMELYGVSSVKGYFDGKTSWSYVKIIDPNRILSKKDIEDVLAHLEQSGEQYILSNSPVSYYTIELIASGKELDAYSYLDTRNKTPYTIKIRDMLVEKEGLVFKEPIEIIYTASTEKLDVSLRISDFISPVLLKKLAIENKGKTDEQKVNIEDWKTIVDSIAIDYNYDGKLFNAEHIDLADKKTLVVGSYKRSYEQAGSYTVAIKAIDILGEEKFETFLLDVA